MIILNAYLVCLITHICAEVFWVNFCGLIWRESLVLFLSALQLVKTGWRTLTSSKWCLKLFDELVIILRTWIVEIVVRLMMTLKFYSNLIVSGIYFFWGRFCSSIFIFFWIALWSVAHVTMSDVLIWNWPSFCCYALCICSLNAEVNCMFHQMILDFVIF